MLRSLFGYDLTQNLIAQHPAEPRDSSRMLFLDRKTGALKDMVFRDIRSLLRRGDALVLNDSRVIPARLLGRKDSGAAVELLLLKPLGGDRWECLAKPGKRLKNGAVCSFGAGELTAVILEEIKDGNRVVEFDYDRRESFYALLDRIGLMPLPHYITAPLEDASRYQTVYADERGSSAAPTAGLHFTQPLLDEIEKSGVDIAKITLHVGLGTFRPVKEENIENHLMHAESYTIDETAAQKINAARSRGGRVIAVGTTSCRTLEAAALEDGHIPATTGETDIFIYPGYIFKAVDGLITNFHLPESTLIMLVCAFAGYDETMTAYKRAVAEKYRFFSFGDAMCIL